MDTRNECITLHSVAIHDRGGVRRIPGGSLVDVASVEWTRERDQTSLAKVVISGDACRAQSAILGAIAPRRHELVLYRGADRVWEGPITDVRWLPDRVEILASDVFEYIDNTPLSIDWPNSDGGGPYYMTERVSAILAHELTVPYDMEVALAGPSEVITVPRWESLTPPSNILPHLDVRPSVSSSGILTRSSTLAFEMTVGEHLRNLAEGGLDFVAIGRKLLFWDSAQSIGSTRVLTEADFYGSPEVTSAGSEHASIGHVSAQRDEEDGADPMSGVGNAGGPDPFYGVWTRLVSLASEDGTDAPTQLALNTQARRQLVGRNPVPTDIRVGDGAGLRLSHDLTINQLVPGVVMPVRAILNGRSVAQDQRLDKLTVREAPAGETVQILLSPSGALEGLS